MCYFLAAAAAHTHTHAATCVFVCARTHMLTCAFHAGRPSSSAFMLSNLRGAGQLGGKLHVLVEGLLHTLTHTHTHTCNYYDYGARPTMYVHHPPYLT